MKKYTLMILTLLIFLFTSCSNLLGENNSSPENTPAGTEPHYITITGNVSLEGAFPSELLNDSDDPSRAAFPAIPSLSSLSFNIKATNIADKTDYVESNVETGSSTYSLAIPAPTQDGIVKTYRITITAKNGTTEILKGTSEDIDLSTENTVFAKDVALHAITTSGTGGLVLDVIVDKEEGNYIADSAHLSINDFELPVNESNISDGFRFQIPNTVLPSGVYPARFRFFKGSKEVYSFIQYVNVFAGLKTTKWVKNGNEPYFEEYDSGIIVHITRSLLDAYTLTDIYLDSSATSTSESGTFLNPVKTFEVAVAKINNPTADYTIHVKGSYQGIFSLPSTLDDKMHSLTIVGESPLVEGAPQDKLYGWGSVFGDEKDYEVIKASEQYTTLSNQGKINRVLTIQTSKQVTITNLEISDGLSNRGGGIFLTSANVILNNVYIKNNKAEVGGGGIGTSSGSSIIMNGGKITGNSCFSSNTDTGSTGGGILLNTSTSFIMNNGEISHNLTKQTGGGIAILATGSFTMNDGIITENRASGLHNEDRIGGGGGIYNSGTVTINKGTITQNFAENYGGGIENNGEATIIGGEISGNTCADNRGGAICVDAGSTYNQYPLKIGKSAYIPAGEDNINDIFLKNNNDSHKDGIITLTSALTRHSAANPIKITSDVYEIGKAVVIADGTNITDLTDYKDYFASTNSDANLRIPSDDHTKLTLDMPIFVKQGGTPAEQGTADGTRAKPFANLEAAANAKMNDGELDYSMIVLGTLEGKHLITSGTFLAKSITIRGENGVLDGKDCNDAVLKIVSGHFVDDPITVILEDITITGAKNTTENGGNGNGGGIYVSNATLTLGPNVNITGNKADIAAGVYAKNDTVLNIHSNAKVTDNTNAANTASNVYLPAGKTINITGPLYNNEAPTDKAEIGVTTENPPSLGTNIPVTNGYGYHTGGNNAGVEPSTYLMGDVYAVTDDGEEGEGEAILAVSSGSFYTAMDFNLSSVNLRKPNGLYSTYIRPNQEYTFDLLPNFTRKLNTNYNNTLSLKYNPADNKLYENYDSTTGIYSGVQGNGAEVEFSAPQFFVNNEPMDFECTVAAGENGMTLTVPPIPFEGSYQVLFKVRYLGIEYQYKKELTCVSRITVPANENDSVSFSDPDIPYTITGNVKGTYGVGIGYSGTGDATIEVTLDGLRRSVSSPNFWSGITITNSSPGTTLTVRLIFKSGGYVNGRNHAGLKFNGNGQIKVIFDTPNSYDTSYSFGDNYHGEGCTDISIETPIQPIFEVAEGCTFTGSIPTYDSENDSWGNPTTYTDINAFFAEATNDWHSYNGSKITLKRTN